MTEKALQASLTKGEFAQYLGIVPSYVTALVKAGRVVLDGEGRAARVKVAESLALIEATHGGRFDVARRHAAARRRAPNESLVDTEARSTQKIAQNAIVQADEPERLVDAKTRKESAQADQEEMKAAQMAGNLIAREDVEAAMKFIGAAIRAAMEVFPDQNAPVLAPMVDLNDTHAHLTEACRNVLIDIGAAIERQREQLQAKGAA